MIVLFVLVVYRGSSAVGSGGGSVCVMGQSESTTVCIPPFQDLPTWPLSKSQKAFKVYRDRELDFVIDAAAVCGLYRIDALQANDIVEALADPSSGLVNALSLMAGTAVVSAVNLGLTSVNDKASFLFDLFDIGGKGSLTIDELTILLLSTTRAAVLMLGRGVEPTDAEMEQYSLRMYHTAGIRTSKLMGRKDFLAAMSTILNVSSPQVALTGLGPDEMLVAFGLIPPPPSEGYPYFPPLEQPSLLAKHLTQEAFVLLMDKKTPRRNLGLMELIQPGVDNPTLPVGVVAGDEECYTTFASLLDPIISALHGGYAPNGRHRPDANTAGIVWTDLPSLVGAAGANAVDRVQISVRRNVAGYAFPSAMPRTERREVEAVLSNALKQLSKKLQGTYMSLEGEGAQEAAAMMDDPLLFGDHYFHRSVAEVMDTNRRAASEWADARGVWICNGHPCAALINEEDHLQLTSSDERGDVKAAFECLYNILFDLQTRLEEDGASFTYDNHLGYVTSSPANLGTALNLEITARLPHLSRHGNDLQDISHRLGLHCRQGEREGLFHIVHQSRLGHSEIELLHTVLNGCRLLTQLEAALATGNISQWDVLLASNVPRVWVPPNIPPVIPPRLPISLPLNARKTIRVNADFPTFTPNKHMSIVAQVLLPELYENLKGRQTAAGYSLNDVIRPALDSPAVRVGLCAYDSECFTTFWDLYEAVLPELQGPVVIGAQRPPSDFEVSPLPLLISHACIRTVRVSVSRNLLSFPLTPGLSRVARRKLERLLVLGLESVGAGKYRPLRDETGNDAALVSLKAKGLLFNHPPARDSFMCASGAARDWPDGRGFIVKDYDRCSVAVWINEEDHLRFVGVTETEDLGMVASQVFKLVQDLEAYLSTKGLGYMQEERLGYLTSSPVNLGTGVRVTVGCNMGPDFRYTAKFKAKVKSELSLETYRDASQGLILLSNASTMMEPTEAAVLRWTKGQILAFIDGYYGKEMWTSPRNSSAASPRASSVASPRTSSAGGPPVTPKENGGTTNKRISSVSSDSAGGSTASPGKGKSPQNNKSSPKRPSAVVEAPRSSTVNASLRDSSSKGAISHPTKADGRREVKLEDFKRKSSASPHRASVVSEGQHTPVVITASPTTSIVAAVHANEEEGKTEPPKRKESTAMRSSIATDVPQSPIPISAHNTPTSSTNDDATHQDSATPLSKDDGHQDVKRKPSVAAKRPSALSQGSKPPIPINNHPVATPNPTPNPSINHDSTIHDASASPANSEEAKDADGKRKSSSSGGGGGGFFKRPSAVTQGSKPPIPMNHHGTATPTPTTTTTAGEATPSKRPSEVSKAPPSRPSLPSPANSAPGSRRESKEEDTPQLHGALPGKRPSGTVPTPITTPTNTTTIRRTSSNASTPGSTIDETIGHGQGSGPSKRSSAVTPTSTPPVTRKSSSSTATTPTTTTRRESSNASTTPSNSNPNDGMSAATFESAQMAHEVVEAVMEGSMVVDTAIEKVHNQPDMENANLLPSKQATETVITGSESRSRSSSSSADIASRSRSSSSAGVAPPGGS